MGSPDDSSATMFDTIIIGCGMTGVSTAFHLVTEGDAGDIKTPKKILMLEGRDRVGGRIHGHELLLSGDGVELGANWIHGMMGNPIFEIASNLKLVDPLGYKSQPTTTSLSESQYMVSALTEHGDRIPFPLLEQTYEMYKQFMTKCDAYFDAFDTDGVNPPDCYHNSVGHHLIQDIESYLSHKIVANDYKKERRAIFTNLLHREGVISGCDTIHDCSLRDFGCYESCPGGNFTVDGGYTKIVNQLLHQIQQSTDNPAINITGDIEVTSDKKKRHQFDLKLQSKVTGINWKKKDVDGSTNYCEVIVGDGDHVYRCLHCVVTVPLGVLQHEDITFTPQLPDYKIESIKRSGFSVVNKIFLEFKSKLSPRYLDGTVKEFITLWLDGDRGHEQDDNKITLKTYDPETEWFKSIYSFTRLSDFSLMCWVSGRDALVVEGLDQIQVGKVLLDNILRPFFHPEFPAPDNVMVTRWSSDEFSRGSYSFISTSSSQRDIELIAQPIYSDPGQEKPVLLFGGEHTHSTFFSTVHGAFLSGKKCAQYLADVDDTGH